jgi:hypothetical protein
MLDSPQDPVGAENLRISIFRRVSLKRAQAGFATEILGVSPVLNGRCRTLGHDFHPANRVYLRFIRSDHQGPRLLADQPLFNA